jgi:hypothetical protein
MSNFPEDLSNFQRFPIVYGASAQFKTGSNESAAAGAVAKLQFALNNNPHEITGLRLWNSYEIPEGFLSDLEGGGPLLLARLDGQQTITMRMAQQNVVIDEVLQPLLTGGGGVTGAAEHWHPFELPYPFRGGNNITVDVTRLTGYANVNQDPVVTIDAVTVYAAVVGWMYVGPGGVLSGPPSTGFNAA